jgi:hypothetical protein
LIRTERLLKEIIGHNTERKRRKRGGFNFAGEVSKILFGTTDDDDDDDDANYYNE